MFNFEYHLKNLPDKPGVYIMKNSLGEVIYVGKAKVLKNRVKQYFHSSKNHSDKVRKMVDNISEFEYIITDSEMEALLLECNLIKKYSPKYNISLKDDKFYPFIKITINEDFPKVYVTRNYARDGNKYFGPYVNSAAVHETISMIKKIYPLRTCKRAITEGGEKTRPCLNYHIKLCKGPCAGLQSKEDYGHMIKEIIDILNGKDSNIINNLKEQMLEAASSMEFEKAADLRDKVMAIENIMIKQKMFTAKEGDEDYINLYCDNKDCCIQIFFSRDGKISGREHFIIQDKADSPKGEIFYQFITSFYGGTAQVPKTVYLPEVEESELLEEFLTIKRGSKVWIKVPKKGEKLNLLHMVEQNAKVTLEKFKDKILNEKELNRRSLEELGNLLGLDEIPERIEAYDISNIQGVDSVGTMVVFEEGKPKNSDYRRFRIKTIQGQNDYESMREVLSRRFSRGLKEIKEMQESKLTLAGGKFSVFPDLILMDGGKGQVNIALQVLSECGVDIPVCGLVKDQKHNTRGLIYNNEELFIPKQGQLFRMLARIQDEVHRFAITYHRSLRDKRTLHSILEDIPNVGEKRRKNLLLKFGSVDNIKKATFGELLETPGIDKKAAESIKKYFSGN
ncbi:MAG: excinuclease ABC subunit UvrC [Clostridiaceae bacterium]